MRSGANSGTASSAGELSISCDGAIGVERERSADPAAQKTRAATSLGSALI